MNAPQKDVKHTGSRKARRTAARLAAVQGVYQIIAAGQTARQVIEDFRDHPPEQAMMGESGENMVTPDATLMTAIIGGVEARRGDLEQLVTGTQNRSGGAVEPLLKSVLLCGAYELLAHHDTDAPVIISDYLDVAHAFFDQGEPKLVNAILDKIGKGVRDGA